jgi:hypothetical protein
MVEGEQVERGERVVKVGGCWRWRDQPPWMVDGIEGEVDGVRRVTLARWEAGQREETVMPERQLLNRAMGWHECDPELMELPTVNEQVAASGRANLPVGDGRTDDAWALNGPVARRPLESPPDARAPGRGVPPVMPEQPERSGGVLGVHEASARAVAQAGPPYGAVPDAPVHPSAVQLSAVELRLRAASLRHIAGELEAMARQAELDRS